MGNQEDIYKKISLLEEEIQSELNKLKNDKIVRLYNLTKEITDEKNKKFIYFRVHLLGLLVQDIEIFLSMKSNIGYILEVCKSRISMIEKYFEEIK